MSKYKHSRLEAIHSLEWYELALTVLFSFVAKTSEVLLAFGLIITTTNFLTDGSIMTAHPGLSTAWAWAQSISLDSSLAVCLSYTFQYVRQKDWIKGGLYGLLTLLLSLVVRKQSSCSAHSSVPKRWPRSSMLASPQGKLPLPDYDPTVLQNHTCDRWIRSARTIIWETQLARKEQLQNRKMKVHSLKRFWSPSLQRSHL